MHVKLLPLHSIRVSSLSGPTLELFTSDKLLLPLLSVQRHFIIAKRNHAPLYAVALLLISDAEGRPIKVSHIVL
jgi:hypothetical protein